MPLPARVTETGKCGKRAHSELYLQIMHDWFKLNYIEVIIQGGSKRDSTSTHGYYILTFSKGSG